ncbi:MAG: hypothetical protein GXP54_11875 [Deltaproteobacteria bacterium]|nr:hypothetical protein [Deltaproteobacteria bacterium]
MPVTVNLVNMRRKKPEGEGADAASLPPAKPNLVIRENVMERVRKEKPKACFMADLGNKK